MAEAAPKGFGVSLAVGVIAMFLAIASIAFAYLGASGPVSSLQGQVSTIQTQINSLATKPAPATLNVKPGTIAFRVEWCNTDNTGQDRFCPPTIVVPQGDIVQIMFLTNDTSDAHTFTLIKGGYSFQLNNTYGAPGSSGNFTTKANGMHNFLTNGYFTASCQNGAFAQENIAVGPTYCVSGSSLLPAGQNFLYPINPTPSSAFTPPARPVFIPVDNTFHFISMNGSATNPYTGAKGYFADWSIASFQATTPGVYEYFCYYHVSNGMFGYLFVVPNAYCTATPSACGLVSGGLSGGNSTSTATASSTH
jgi:plastocyanin